LQVQFVHITNQRDHDLWKDIDALGGAFQGGAENGTRLPDS
jgi:hypothetical protein